MIPLMAGIGIVRRRVWGAYGFAVYLLAQILLTPLVLLRAGGAPAGTLVAGGFLLALLTLLFFFAGRSLAAAGAQRGWVLPWIALAMLTTLPLVFLQAFVMPTGSMEDTLLVGDRILVRRFPVPALVRGEVVVFRYPIDRHQIFVKRVVGVAGDHIRISQKILYRNGVAIKEVYAAHKMDYFDSYRDSFPGEPNIELAAPAMEMLRKNVVNGEVVVPEGRYFVLGDNRDQSLDSRYWGFIGAGDVIGKPVLIYESEEQTTEISTGRAAGRKRIRWERFFRLL